MEDENKVFEIKRVSEKIRPYIQRDGGDLEFVTFDDGIVYVRIHGACIGCSAIEFTLKDGVEALLKDEVEGIKAVEIWPDGELFL